MADEILGGGDYSHFRTNVLFCSSCNLGVAVVNGKCVRCGEDVVSEGKVSCQPVLDNPPGTPTLAIGG